MNINFGLLPPFVGKEAKRAASVVVGHCMPSGRVSTCRRGFRRSVLSGFCGAGMRACGRCARAAWQTQTLLGVERVKMTEKSAPTGRSASRRRADTDHDGLASQKPGRQVAAQKVASHRAIDQRYARDVDEQTPLGVPRLRAAGCLRTAWRAGR